MTNFKYIKKIKFLEFVFCHYCILFVIGSFLFLFLSFRATASNYYIDDQTDFNTYKNYTFSPGDNIYFKRGITVTGNFTPQGSGTSSNRIIVDAYDSGSKPIINSDGTGNPCVKLLDQSYWTIKNLEMKNNSTSSAYGILCKITEGVQYGILIEDCYIHDCEEIAIYFVNAPPMKKIQNVNFGNYLRGMGNVDGSDVELWDLDTSWFSQKWFLRPTGNTNEYRIRNANSGNYLRGMGDVDGSAVELWELDTSWFSQKWLLKPTGNTNEYRIQNVNFGNYLRGMGDVDGSDTELWELDSGWTTQKWIIDSAGGGGIWEDCSIRNNVIETINSQGIRLYSEWHTQGDFYPDMPDEVLWENMLIENNIIVNTAAHGIQVVGTLNSEIRSNLIDTASNGKTGNSLVAVGNRGLLVEYNEVRYGIGDEGDIDPGGGINLENAHNCIAQYNYVHHNDGNGLMFMGGVHEGTGVDSTFRYNIVEANGRASIFFWTPNSITGAEFYNNTIYTSGGTKVISSCSSDTKGPSVTYRNNIFYTIGTADYYLLGDNHVFDYNVFYQLNPPANEPSDSHKLTSNPLLAYPGRGNIDGYKLLSGSPAIDSGTAIPDNGSKDYWGTTLYVGNSIDRGAYEGVGISTGNFDPGEYYRFQNVNFANYLRGMGDIDGSDVELWELDSSWFSQKWIIEATGSPNEYRIKNLNFGNYLRGMGDIDGSDVELWDLDSSWFSQKWIIEATGSPNEYRIQNVNFGNYLRGMGDIDGSDVELWELDSSWFSQKWIIHEVP